MQLSSISEIYPFLQKRLGGRCVEQGTCVQPRRKVWRIRSTRVVMRVVRAGDMHDARRNLFLWRRCAAVRVVAISSNVDLAVTVVDAVA